MNLFSRPTIQLRLRHLIIVMAVSTAAACVPTAQQSGTGAITTGSVHYTISAPTSYNRTPPGQVSTSADPGAALGNALGALAQSGSAVQRIANTLPEPQDDPAQQLANTIVASLAAQPAITRGQSVQLGQVGTPQEIAARARARSLSGALLSISRTVVRFYGSGAAMQVGGNRVVVGLTSTIDLVDIASGELIARSVCRESRRTRRADVDAGLQGFSTREGNALVQSCAAEFLGRVQ